MSNKLQWAKRRDCYAKETNKNIQTAKFGK